MIVTLGLPYLQYRVYRHQQAYEAHSSEMYFQMIEALDTLWGTYSYLSLPMFPLVFPMVSSSGVFRCLTASLMAVMTLIVGVINIATSTIYKLKFKSLHIDEWKVSQNPWRKVPNKSFWLLVSLPTFFFFLSVSLLIATAILTVWERPVDGMAPNPMELRGCPMKRLQAFKNILLVTLAAAVAHLVFVITKMYSMTVLVAPVNDAV